jgi:hypothetical protein
VTCSQSNSAQVAANARDEWKRDHWNMVRRVNRARNRGPKLIARCFTHLYGTRHPDYIRRADAYSMSSGADQAGSRMRFKEARDNGRTLAQQVAHDIAHGTENYMLCGGDR